ncbi:hypothetical protein [Rhodoferax antarcticus]|uniref:hypothetical protein n=1 Tax=Rhodoferax antarcticus TaxID=81479 RepID=UPI0013905E91|nr:hypothetical protein [Rhodoferax antarcticus]
MARRTSSGKFIRSRFDEPTHSRIFSTTMLHFIYKYIFSWRQLGDGLHWWRADGGMLLFISFNQRDQQITLISLF